MPGLKKAAAAAPSSSYLASSSSSLAPPERTRTEDKKPKRKIGTGLFPVCKIIKFEHFLLMKFDVV
jgi:hypothetical protein